jgi:hypothetical protein
MSLFVLQMQFIYSTLLHCFLAGKDLWIYVEDQDMVNMETELSENPICLFVYISKLPLYECHLQCFQFREGFSLLLEFSSHV